MATCAHCGFEDARGRFCGRCGEALSSADVSLAGIGIRPAVPRRWILLGGGVALALAAIVWFVSCSGSEDLAQSAGGGVAVGVGDGGSSTSDSGVTLDGGAPGPAIRIGIPRPFVGDAGPPEEPIDAGTDAGASRAPERHRRRAARRSTGASNIAGSGAGAAEGRSSGSRRSTSTGSSRRSSTPSQLSPSAYMASARRHVAHTYRAQIQSCFNAGVQRNPGVRGTIIVNMVPHQDGRIAASRVVGNTTGDPEIGACIVRASRSWRLPAPPRRTLEIQLRYSL